MAFGLTKEQEEEIARRHCDNYIRDKSQPLCLRKYLFLNRLPAYMKYDNAERRAFLKNADVLFADYKGKRVRVVMASRLGDVGITKNLKADHGYDKRVYVDELTNFSEEP